MDSEKRKKYRLGLAMFLKTARTLIFTVLVFRLGHWGWETAPWARIEIPEVPVLAEEEPPAEEPAPEEEETPVYYPPPDGAAGDSPPHLYDLLRRGRRRRD